MYVKASETKKKKKKKEKKLDSEYSNSLPPCKIRVRKNKKGYISQHIVRGNHNKLAL